MHWNIGSFGVSNCEYAIELTIGKHYTIRRYLNKSTDSNNIWTITGKEESPEKIIYANSSFDALSTALHFLKQEFDNG